MWKAAGSCSQESSLSLFEKVARKAIGRQLYYSSDIFQSASKIKSSPVAQSFFQEKKKIEAAFKLKRQNIFLQQSREQWVTTCTDIEHWFSTSMVWLFVLEYPIANWRFHWKFRQIVKQSFLKHYSATAQYFTHLVRKRSD